MANVVFFTKPGCITGMKQQELLRQAGHELNVRNILDHPWTPGELRPFFGGRPIKEWFNPNSPRIKSGEVVPFACTDEEHALQMMVADPFLIRRPLMQVGERRESGFDQEMIHAWIGLAPTGGSEFRQAGDLQSCSAPVGKESCPEPEEGAAP